MAMLMAMLLAMMLMANDVESDAVGGSDDDGE